MPSPAWIHGHILDRILPTSPSRGATNETNIPSFSGTSTTGTILNAPEGGHMQRLLSTGHIFRNIPSAGNAYMPGCPLMNRFELIELFKQKPALNAVLDTTGASSSAALIAYTIANKDFEVLGSNMTTALCTFVDGGGIKLTTAGGANATDAAIVTPHLDTAQSAWAAAKWNTLDCIEFETMIQPVAVTTTKVYAGFKLTNTDVAATDDNQVYFVLDTGDTLGVSTTNWVCVSSRAGTDTAVDSGIKATAGGPTHLLITTDPNRIPYFYINGVLVAVGNGTDLSGVTTSTGALTTNIDLIPYIGCIQRTNSTAAAVIVRGLRCAKLYNDCSP